MDDLQQRLEIKAIGESLPKGATTNDQACPWCGVNKSFSVSHKPNGRIAYICHRASCDKAGYIQSSGICSNLPQERVFTPRVFNLATMGLAGEWEAHLLAAYGVTRKEIDWAGWCYSPIGDRLCMPVKGPYGQHRGWVTKRLVPGSGPKSDQFREVDDVWMGWYSQVYTYSSNPNQAIVVVEDLISALVASRYYPTVALLGTNLNDEKVEEILSQHYNVRLCLDKDATIKSFDFSKKYKLYGNFIPIPLSKDIKNMNSSQLEEWNAEIRRSIKRPVLGNI